MEQPTASSSAPLRFADVTIDPAAMVLRRGNEVVAVQPQVFDLLLFLARNHERVVPKRELLEEVWGSAFVSESALTSRVASAREAVGDDGRTQAVIRTVHGRGYQFIATLDEVVPATASAAAAGQPTDDPGGAGPGPASTRPSTEAPRRLSPPPKALVDRTELRASASSALRDASLVTLLGPAGVGKTLAAHHVAAANQDAFPDGAWIVQLGDVREHEDVALAVLDTIGGSRFPTSTTLDTLEHVLGRSHALLVLDNCEHVLEGAADLVARLLAVGGPLTVLATSRRRLGVPGELVVPVPVLEHHHAVELFLRRAAEQGTPIEGSPLVGELCRSLDQLPLALELASAQARVLGVDKLAGLLDERLELLLSPAPGGARTTLEGAIASSFDQLDRGLQETLGRFSQFAGGFDLDAATAVATHGRDLSRVEAIRHVVALAERCLLEVSTDAVGTTRYRLLESIRLFAGSRLGDADAARRAHIACYVDRALDQGEAMVGPGFEAAWQAMQADWPNHRAAIRHAIEVGQMDDALAILAASSDHAEITLAFDHATWADRVLAVVGDRDDLVVRTVRAGRARLYGYEQRIDELVRSAAEAGDPADGFAFALTSFWAAAATGDVERVRHCWEALVDHAEGTGGLHELVLGAVSHVVSRRFDQIDPRVPTARALAVGRHAGPVSRAFVRTLEAHEAHATGDVEGTLDACREAAEWAHAQSLEVLAAQVQALRVAAVRRHPDDALVAECVLAAMRHYDSRGHWTSTGNDAPVAARVLAAAGLHEDACAALAHHRPLAYRGVDEEYLAWLKDRYGVTPAPAPDLAASRRDPRSVSRWLIALLEQAQAILIGGHVA